MTAADIELDVMIAFRARLEDRKRWNRAARLAGKSYAAWARATLSAEAGRIERKAAAEKASGHTCGCTCGADR
jgi:hypothetical protein